jgi:hypothetical protein
MNDACTIPSPQPSRPFSEAIHMKWVRGVSAVQHTTGNDLNRILCPSTNAHGLLVWGLTQVLMVPSQRVAHWLHLPNERVLRTVAAFIQSAAVNPHLNEWMRVFRTHAAPTNAPK